MHVDACTHTHTHTNTYIKVKFIAILYYFGYIYLSYSSLASVSWYKIKKKEEAFG